MKLFDFTSIRVPFGPNFPWRDLGLASLAFGLGHFVNLGYASTTNQISLNWLSASLGLIAVLRLPRFARRPLLAGFFLTGLIAHLIQGTSPLFAMELSLWTLVEILVANGLIRRLVGKRPTPLSIQDALKALFLALFVALPIGAGLVGTSAHLHLGTNWFTCASHWWTSNAIGILLLLAPGLAAGRREWKKLATKGELIRFLTEVIVVIPLVILALTNLPQPFIVITIPFSILALRIGLLRTSLVIWTTLSVILVAQFSGWISIPEVLWATKSLPLGIAGAMSAFLPILIGVIGDQAKNQLALIQASEQRFRSIFDSATTGFALLDQDGKILKLNIFFQHFLGRDPSTLLGLHHTELLVPEDRTSPTQPPEEISRTTQGKGSRFRFQSEKDETNIVWGLSSIRALAGSSNLFLLQVEDIHDAVVSELELIRSRATLQSMIDNLPGMVGLWGTDLRNQFANKAYVGWFGTSPESLKGKHLRDFLGEELFEQNAPFIHAALQGETITFERELATQSGQRWSLATYVPNLLDGQVVGFYVMVTDITPVKLAQKAELDSLTRLSDIIDGASEFSIIATDLDGTIQLFSLGAQRMLGYRADEVVGLRNPTQFHLPEELERRSQDLQEATGKTLNGFDCLVDAARLGESDSRAWTYLKKNRSTVPVQLVVTPLHNHLGEVDGFLGVARDITTEREAIRAIEDARAQAEYASLMKSEFVANMSHEIRTPMNAVLGMVQLIGKTSISPNQRKYLDMIRKSGRSLLGILDDILDFSKIEAGRMRIEPVDFLLDDLLENISNIASVNASGKDLEISITVDPSVPVQLHGDSLRLQQVLVNLIGNALKFTMQGEVAVTIEVLSADENWTRIGIRIRDTGIGMTDEQQRRLFQPFSQVDSSNTRRFGGTGLGLTITKKLLDMMGGQIGVRSMSQIGTEFFISLPFPKGNTTDTDPQVLAIRPLSLLALEDHPSSQLSLEASASRWGWKIEFVPNLHECLEVLDRREVISPFDAILVDGSVAGWDDRRCIERIREICQREVTVIKMVRTAVENPADEGIRLLDGILVKPITSLGLLKVLKNNLGQPVDEEEESRQHLEQIASERLTLQGIRILLVEDNAFNQVVATETLQALGAGVDLAENGKAAVDQLKRNPQSYDLVLMDVQMPVMDGYTATRIIREELKLTHPVIAMTAGVLPSDRDKCMACGMNGFISKPFEVEELIRIFRRHLPNTSIQDKQSAQPPRTGRKPVFHADQLLHSLGNTKEAMKTVRSLVKQFLDIAPGTIRMGRECVGRGDLEEATRAFHNLKSSSATLGAMAFASLAQQIELGLQESERKNLIPLIEQLSDEYDRVFREAGNWLKATDFGPLSEPGVV